MARGELQETTVIDKIAWDRAVAVQKVEIASIVETVSRWPTTAKAQ